MVRVFGDLLRAEQVRGGRFRVARILVGGVFDALLVAPAAWCSALRASLTEAPSAGEEQVRPAFGGLRGDLRYAVRGLRRQPVHSLACLLTLALGIGANTALWSVVDRVFLRPLPYRDAERVMTLWDTRPADGRTHENPSPGNFLDWSRSPAFEAMAAWQDGTGTATLRGEHEAVVLETVKVTPSFFRVLGVPPLLGRTFDDATERGAVFNVADRYSGGDRVIVLSFGLWKDRFAADPAVVGRSLDMDGVSWKVVGVMPEGFALPRPTTQVFVPWDIVPSFASFQEGPPRDLRFLNVLARLRTGWSVKTAEADLQALAATLAVAHPRANAGWSVRLVPLREELLSPFRPAVLLVGTAVGLVLLLACANVAGLQLARATGRRREMAIRLSLGASRRRLLRQLLTESALLALLGGALGLVVAQIAQSLILSQAPPGIPGTGGGGLDPRALAFAGGLSVLTAVLFGLVPALEASRVPLAGALHDGGRSATQGPRVRRLRRLLVAGEVAAALVLLAGAGLVGRSLLRVLAVDTGFDPQGLVSLRVSLDHATYKTGAQSRQFYRALLPRLAGLPGAAGAGAVTALPLHPVGTDFARPYWREGEPDPGGNAARADIRMATPGYFDALRMTLRRGRAFADADDERSPRVIVVNETLARQAFGTDDPVGRRLVLDYMGGSYPYEIVGLVGDVRFGSVKAAPRPEIFIPHAQNPYLDLTVVVRAQGDAATIVSRVRQEIAAIDPRQPAHAVATMDELVRRSTAADRLLAAVLMGLAGLALVLAATGLHGLLAYLVGQRTQELGLRQALGATPAQVIGLVMGESLRLVLAGGAMGLLLALALLPQVSALLYEVGPSDVWAWAGAVGLLLTTAIVASLIPARAAARVDPLAALRAE